MMTMENKPSQQKFLARLRDFFHRENPNVLRKGLPPGPKRSSHRPQISQPELNQNMMSIEDKTAIRNALITHQPLSIGKMQYNADNRSPWASFHIGQSIEGSPIGIQTHTYFSNDNGTPKPMTQTTVTLTEKSIINPDNPQRIWNNRMVDGVRISFLSERPLHLDIQGNMKFTQTEHGININNLPIESYFSKREFLPPIQTLGNSHGLTESIVPSPHTDQRTLFHLAHPPTSSRQNSPTDSLNQGR